jgi:hypothetical protein
MLPFTSVSVLGLFQCNYYLQCYHHHHHCDHWMTTLGCPDFIFNKGTLTHFPTVFEWVWSYACGSHVELCIRHTYVRQKTDSQCTDQLLFVCHQFLTILNFVYYFISLWLSLFGLVPDKFLNCCRVLMLFMKYVSGFSASELNQLLWWFHLLAENEPICISQHSRRQFP